MITTILSAIAHWITGLISNTGYTGVLFLMIIESAGIPAPSEVIMPFAGFLVHTGRFNLYLVTLVGALGNLVGSLIAWWIGAKGGRPLIEKYGRLILISKHDLDLSDRFFSKFGNATVFIGRLLPIIRTYISFPAGIAKMPIVPFSIYTFLGALPWSLALAMVGRKLGENWQSLKGYFHQLDVGIAIILIGGIVWWIARHIRNERRALTKL